MKLYSTMWKFIVSTCCLTLLSGSVYCQIDSSELRPPKPPKVKKELKEFIPTGIIVGADMFSISRSIWEDHLTQQEYQVDVDFRHYNLTLGYGVTDIERQSDAAFYTNDGSYWRANIQVNLLYNSPHRSELFLGFGYARATFDDQLVFDTQDAFGTTQVVTNNDQASARWFELTTGVKVHIWKQFYMGYTVRYKFIKKVNFDNLIPTDVPGFGQNSLDDKDQFGFNYYLQWRFPLRKASKVSDLN